MVEVILPKVDMAMTEGTIATWLRQEGERVAAGEALFEVETDKANVEVEAPASGTLWGVRAIPGETVAIASVVAYILAPGEQPPADPTNDERQTTNDKRQTTNDKRQTDADTVRQKQHGAALSDAAEQNRIRATPLARKIGREHGVDLTAVAGSGPQGRIGGQDVRAYIERTTLGETPNEHAEQLDARAVAPNDTPEATEDVTKLPLTALRKIIADRMTASVRNAPHFNLNMTVDMAEMVALRQRIAPATERQTGAKPSFTVLLARVLAPLLLHHPLLNATWNSDSILLHHRVHLGIALDREGDLLVPVIRDAHRLSIAELTTALRDTTERARQRKLAPDALRGSTFTISNLGMFGVDSFTAIINPPESAILAVGRVVDAAVVRDGTLTVRPTMQLTLSADHRLVDGATAARFFADLRSRLEEPYLLL